MASFGWKRKVGEKVSKSVVQQFEAEEDKAAQHPRDDDEEEVDWMHAVKRRREELLEDCATRSRRLKEEGAALAEEGRHWEALKKWDEAIQMTPDNPDLYEMKSQVLTILQEVFPAVKAAETAVKFRPLWWEGWQTLGRAQLNLGEVDLAVRSFQVAIHLRPSERALWQDDLRWACRLQKQQSATKEKLRQEEETKRQIDHAPELNRDYDDFESDEVLAACVAVAERQTRYEELRRTAVVVDAEGNIQNVVTAADGSDDAATPSKEQFIKARGL